MSTVSESMVPGHRPPFLASIRTSRERLRCPPPQEELHAVQASHWPSVQSVGISRRQPSGRGAPSVGRHGAVCLRSPVQARPRPRGWTGMPRERLMMPSQLLLQSPQADQPEKAQSMSGSHRTPSLQLACTLDAPDTGLPHCLTSARITREHQATPPSHVLEQGSQPCQSSHCPSMQASFWHDWVLHGSVSSLLHGSQGLPPL